MTFRRGPIGIFDSGVGGLTVAGALLRRHPRERIVYVADQAHVPYGGRPLDEIQTFARGISATLVNHGCRAVVMACNISTATALGEVAASLAPLPVLGVIAPAVERLARTDERRVGVLATAGTVQSGAYSRQICARLPDAEVVEVPCPAFVPLVEAFDTDGAAATRAAKEYLTPLAARQCRVIILGCTHYPYLLPVLRRVSSRLFAEPVAFVDPADEISAALHAALPDLGDGPAYPGDGPAYPGDGPAYPGDGPADIRHLLLTTGDTAAFRAQAERLLPCVAFDVASAHWSSNHRLRFPQEFTDTK